MQHTVKEQISFKGIGLHSGVDTNITIKPAEADSGIVFRRIDKSGNNEIKALYSSVVNTQLGTTIANQYGVVVKTIEHFMFALFACGVDNATIELDNEEVPIMDGSAAPFIDTIKKAGLLEQKCAKKYLQIAKPVEVVDGDKSIKLLPHDGFSVQINVEFNYGGIGKQAMTYDVMRGKLADEISLARTFCNAAEIEFMRKNGLAKGGTLDNAMVFDSTALINQGGFRCENEVVKHKLLDCIGDMFTSGYNLKCNLIADKPGHSLNNMVLKKLFGDSSNYKIA